MQVAIVTLVLLGAASISQIEGKKWRPQNVVSGRGEPEPCSQLMCMMYCKNGFEKDEYGCDICKCKGESYAEPEPPAFAEPERKPKGFACKLPKVVGRCRGRQQMWYFDSATEKCSEFFYGGCGGNENKFPTKEACEEECGKKPMKPNEPKEPKEPKKQVSEPCPKEQPQVKCYVDPCTHSKCPKYPSAYCRANYCGGCRSDFYLGTKNVTAYCEEATTGSGGEATEPNSTSVCFQPSITGRCRAMMRRWYYNKQSGKCELFVYGGCGGNENNFHTQKECEQKCGAPPSPTPAFETVGHGEVASASVNKFDSVRRLAELAEQQGILHPSAPRNITQEAHHEYPNNMKVCLCY